MNRLSPTLLSFFRVLNVSLLLFALLTMPLASATAAAGVPLTTASATAKADAQHSTAASADNSIENRLFVNRPSAPMASTSLFEGAKVGGSYAVKPWALLAPPGQFTVTMNGTLVDKDADSKLDPTTGAPATTERVDFTVTLDNQSGTDGLGLSFADFLDSHTTLVPGTLNSTPVAFDKAVSTNEDVALSITISGQDPDGSNVTFRNGATHAAFGASTATANGTLGAFSAPDCATTPGICTTTATYTPNANFSGSDSFTFEVNDGTATSNQVGTVSITVNSVNDAPTFTVPGNPAASNEDAGAQSVSNFITGVRPAQVGNTTEDGQTVSFVITNNTNTGLFSAQPALNVTGASYPKTATLTYTAAANQNGTATITYHALDNGGTANGGVDVSADQTFTITVNAVNDAPVVTPPAPFAAQANMKVTGLTGLLGNVTDADSGVNGCNPSFTVTNVSATSPVGGTISNLNASTGSFDFDPPPGVTGAVTFTYTVTDNGCPGTATSAAATVTVNVGGPIIWFVNPALGSNGDGRLSNPFNSLASANTKLQSLAASQRIFVFSGSTAVGDAVTLQGSTTGTQAAAQAAAHWLIGQGVAGSDFDTVMGITPPTGTIARPSINGTRPIVRGTVTMKENTVVRGLNIDVSGGGSNGLVASSLAGGASGSVLTIEDVNVTSAAGNAVDISASSLNSNNSVIYTTSNASTKPNTINSGTGTALRVVNMTIGASGLTFRSITAGTASDSNGSGIILDNTGSTGSLTVSGNGSAGTGGTIQHKNGGDIHSVNTDGTFNITGTTGVGIFLRNTKSPSFSWMQLNDFSNFAVLGSSVTGLTLDRIITSGVNGSNTNVNEAVMHFDNLTTSASITNSTIQGGISDNFSLINTTAGSSLDRIVFNTVTFGPMDSGNTNGDDSLFIQARNTATVKVTVQNSTLTSSRGDIFQFDLTDTATGDLIFKKNTVNNQHPFVVVGGGGMTLSGGGAPGAAPTLTYDIGGANAATDANTFRGARGDALLVVFQTGHGTATGKIRNNTFGVAGVDKSGASEASDIDIRTVGRAAQTVLIDHNILRQYGNSGIVLQAGDNSVAGTSGTIGDINATVTNNTITEFNTNAASRSGINVNLGTTASPSDTTLMCVDIQNNDAPNSGSEAGSASRDYLIRQRQSTTMRLPGYTGASGVPSSTEVANVTSYIQGRNTNGASSSVFVATPSGGGGYLNTVPAGSPCVQPTLPSGAMFKADGVRRDDLAQIDNSFQNDSTDALSSFLNTRFDSASVFESVQDLGQTTPAIFRDDAAQSAHAFIALASATTREAALKDAAPVAPANGAHAGQTASAATASGLWSAAEPSSHNAATSNTARSETSYASDINLLLSGAGVVKAAAQPMAESVSARLDGGSVSDEKVSLGHGAARRDVSVSSVAAGNTAASTMFAPPSPPPGTFPVNGVGSGFTLPNNKTVTITFSVTLNNPPNLSGVPPATPQVSNHGTLSGSNVSPIDTNTVTTPVDLFDTTTTLSSTPAPPWNSGQAITLTAAVASNPAGNPTAITGTVTFKDNGNTISGCGSVAVSSGQAQCPIASLASGAHSIQAFYNGDGNFDPSTSNTLSQTANANPTSTTVTSSLNPSLVTQSVTFTATVASTGAFTGPPTGTVQFKDGASNLGAAQTLNGSGVATLTTSALTAGSHSITAVYSGDSNFATSTGTLDTDPQVVNKSNTTAALVSSQNPATPGTSITFTVTVTSQTSVTGPPAGTAQFFDGANPLVCDNGGTSTQTLNGSGVATCQTDDLTTVGSPHSITAVYTGDGSANGSATFNGSTSNAVSQVISACSANVVVMNTNDSGAGSLREAITSGVCDGGTITFDSTVFAAPGPHIINLTDANGELLVNKSMTITGPGASVLTVQRDPTSTPTQNFRVFNIAAGKTVTISGMTIANGSQLGADAVAAGASGSPAFGGGILNNGTLTLSNTIVSGNTATGGKGGDNTGAAGGTGGDAQGGAIFNIGTLTLSNTTVSGSTATGGKGGDSDTTNGDGGNAQGAAIYSTGTLTLTNSTISSNTATGGVSGTGAGTAGNAGGGDGGGIYNDGSASGMTVTISGSTFNGNTASLNGGGIYSVDTTTGSTLTLQNSTISGNFAKNDGGGIHNVGASMTTTLTSVTVTNNHADNDDSAAGAGGGINVVSGTVTLKNSIVAVNYKGSGTTTLDDINGAIDASSSFNLVGVDTGMTGITNGSQNNQVGTAGTPIDPLLSALADNGGPTKTHALQTSGPASPALEAGNSFGLTVDQRGFPRPVNFDSAAPPSTGDDSDIGAFEAQTAATAPGAPTLDAASDSGVLGDNKTNDTSPTFNISGTTTGATVELLRDDDGPGGAAPHVVATGIAPGATTQLTDPGPLTAGSSYTYTARQTLGSDTSPESSATTITIDITPNAPDLDAASDTGVSDTDNITNDTSPTFTITGIVPSATSVKLYRDDDGAGGNPPAVVATLAGPFGGTSVQLTDPSVSTGTYLYTATQTVGTESDQSAALTVQITITPDMPDLIAASDSGASNTDNITNSTDLTFNITGVINGATVELLRDGNPIGGGVTGVAAGASIQLTDTGAPTGSHQYSARQTVGVTTSPQSAALTVTKDTTAPTPAIPDLTAASDKGASNTDDITDNSTPRNFTISSTELGSTVQLLRGGVAVAGATTAGTGAAVTVADNDSLADGPYSYTTVETDVAGNTSPQSSALVVTIDTTAPTVSSVVRANANPTNAASVDFTVTFSEVVTGVDATDFALTTTGGITGASVTGVTGSGAVYTVTVNTGTGDGTLRLDVLNDNSIKDVMNLALAAGFTAGQVYTVSKSDPFVVSITRANANPTNAASVDFTVTFSKSVTGVNTSDFALTTTGVAGASISGVTGSGAVYTVTVNTGTGDGSIRLDVVDDDSIVDSGARPLGGTGAGNGNFTTGEVYTIDKTVPTVTINQAAGQADPATGPTSSTVIHFTAVFTEAVTGFDGADIVITGTAGATVANVTEIAPLNGTTYDVAVEGMTGSGTVIVNVSANAATDAAGNFNTASTSSDNTVNFIKDNFSTFVVNTTADTNDGSCDPVGTGNGCTLREALNLANGDAGAETISFDATVFAAPGPYTINLTGALPDITSAVTINGPGANVLTVKRNTGGNYRIFTISDGNVTIDGLTISNGNATGSGLLQDGGGIRSDSTGIVTITNSAISGNSSDVSGGGIAGNGTGALNIINSTISGNTALQGGGAQLGAASVNITNSTISGNSATGNGGGIFTIFVGLTLTITDSTITNNRADTDNNGTGTGGGIFRNSGTIILRGSIVAANYNDASPSTTTPDDINGTVNASSSFNLIGAGGSGGLVNGTNENQVGVANPGLDPLGSNGGPTQTHALQCTSPAIDKGNSFTLTADQRGLTRPFDLSDTLYPNASGGDGADIGALETQGGAGCVPLAVPPSPQPSTNEDTPVTITLKGTYSQNTPLTFTITQNPASGTLGSISAPNCVFTTVQTCTATVQYTPNLNYNGPDSFKFKVSAGAIDSDDAGVTITINAVNDPPVASPQILTTDEDTALPITLTGTDVDSASLTFATTNPAHGTLSAPTVNCATPGNCTADVTYTPNANYNGADSFTYKVNDGSLDSNVATITLNVHSIGDTPGVTNATTTINKQTTSGLVITRNAADGPEIGTFIISNIQNGTLFKNNGTTQITNGQAITVAEGGAGLKFTPDHNLTSPSTTFSFDVQAANNGAGDGISAAATATITVNCSASSVVTNSADSGAGSLRDAVINACPGGTITFNIPTGDPGFNSSTGVTTITLTSAELLIDRDLTITGTGANKLTIKRDAAATNFRIFNISPAAAATVNISGLTISGGSVPGGAGGGISIAPLAPGQVTLSGVAVTSNTANDGGGISITTNTVVNIIHSLVANNTTSVGNGGGIHKDTGSLTVVNSTISGNQAANNGGGINNGNGSLALTNVTLTNNRAMGGVGGGVQSQSAANTVTLNNSILAGNFQGPGSNFPDNFFDGPAPGSINTTGSFNNIFGSQGFSGNGNQQNVADAGLASLADNGGPTLSHLLLPSSTAIDKGNNAKAVDQTNAPLTTDQRGTGFQRISNTTVDIGALEVSYANTATAGTPQSATINATFATQLKATITESGIAKANIPVTFTAPASGASGTFTGNTTTVTVNTDASGVATATAFTANGTAGSYNVVATLAAGQPVSTFSLTNNTATTATALTSSVNPSDFGETVTFTATVSSSAGTPTGTVQFIIDGSNAGAPVTLAGGVATFSTSTLAVGNHSVSVAYAGDGNYLPSTATLAGGQQVVKPVPTLSINDVTLNEGNAGTTAFNFTVTLSAASNLTVKVDYATANGTATAPSDYQAQSNTLTFTPGQTTKTITVLVNGDTTAEADETFFVNLSNPVNADISDNQGRGNIISEDTPLVELSASSYTVAESGLRATITVNRLGDLSKPATADYATSDPSGLNNCSQVTGNASQRCDYATSVGILRFAAGEASKTISIPIVNDVWVEGPESFTLTLSNLSGAEPGAVSSATINITDDDNGVAVNPITNDAFFVRQLYIDFLGREPEPAGLQAWLDVLHNTNGQCHIPSDCDRIAVAIGFVRSPEFQERGYFAFRFYTTALGRNPSYAEFIPDMARLSGFLNNADLEANKDAFVAQFMNRQEFKNLYDPTIGSPMSYVDKLLQTVGLPNHPTRNTWIAGLTNNTLTRQQVLRQLVESTEVYAKFYNQAIIVMNYFGFLRRDPDAAYQVWIDIFNHSNDYRNLTNGFMNSPEYFLRFGP